MGCDCGLTPGGYDARDYADVRWEDAGDYIDEIVDGGDVEDIDGASDATEDGGDVVDQCSVGDRTGITNYAPLTCNPSNLIVANSQIFGMCPTQLFSCPITTPPTTCSMAVEMPAGVDLEGETIPVRTARVVDLGANRLLALYGADSATSGRSASGIMLINASSYEVMQHVVMVTTSYGSGGGSVTLTPRQPSCAVEGDRLYVGTANQNPVTRMSEPGFFFSMPMTTTGQIDQRNLGDTTVTFAGRNLRGLALLDDPRTAEVDDDMLWAYNAYAPPETIPFSLEGIKIYVMNNRPDSLGIARVSSLSSPVEIRMDPLPIILRDPLPGEPTNPSVIPYVVTDPANPVMVDTDTFGAIDIDDLYLGDQMLVVGDYGVAASGTSAILYMPNLGSPMSAVVARDMSSSISGLIVSIAYSGTRVFVVSDGEDEPNFHGIDVPFTSTSTIGGGVYVGYVGDAGEAACVNTTGLCWIAVERTCETGSRGLVQDDTRVTGE